MEAQGVDLQLEGIVQFVDKFMAFSSDGPWMKMYMAESRFFLRLFLDRPSRLCFSLLGRKEGSKEGKDSLPGVL